MMIYKKGEFIRGNLLFIWEEINWSIEIGYEEFFNVEEVVKKLIFILEYKKNEIINM